MVLHNPNNWHWVNKDVRPWAKDYLEEQVVGISAEDGEVSAKITKLTSMDGDVDVSQRKGKVITIFDVSVRLDYEGTRSSIYERSALLTDTRKKFRRYRCRRQHQDPRIGS